LWSLVCGRREKGLVKVKAYFIVFTHGANKPENAFCLGSEAVADISPGHYILGHTVLFKFALAGETRKISMAQ
jgi:hypothetical protein